MQNAQRRSKSPRLVVALGAFVLCSSNVRAQTRNDQPAQAAASPRAASPVDLTGYWVAVITEDWIYRMMTPPKGDYASVPLNANGRAAADQWDPAKDIAAGEQCRSFGAAGMIRMPTRLHVTWQDDHSLKMEFDKRQSGPPVAVRQICTTSSETELAGLFPCFLGKRGRRGRNDPSRRG
jgi:hypothetical protein